MYATLLAGIILAATHQSGEPGQKAAPSPPPATCEKPVEFQIASSLALGRCTTIDPLSVDINKIRSAMRSCTLPSGRRVEHLIRSADLTNHAIRIFEGDKSIAEFTPRPSAKLVGGGGGVPPTLACDTEIDRFYFFHPLVGYVAAYDRDGNMLWQDPVPDFIQIESKPVKEELDAKLEALDTWASIGVQIQASAPYVLVEFKTAKRGSRQVIYHRSGKRVGGLGPWDGRTIEATAGGWKIASGGGVDSRFFVPKASEILQVTDQSIDLTMQHALVWLTPRPSSRQFGIDCLARPKDELQYWLGDRYSPTAAEKARGLLLQQGQDLIDRLAQGRAVAETLKSFNPTTSAWQHRLWHALQEDGLDIRLAKGMTP